MDRIDVFLDHDKVQELAGLLAVASWRAEAVKMVADRAGWGDAGLALKAFADGIDDSLATATALLEKCALPPGPRGPVERDGESGGQPRLI